MKFKWAILLFFMSTGTGMGVEGGFQLKSHTKYEAGQAYNRLLEHAHDGYGFSSTFGHILDEYPYLVLACMAAAAFFTVVFTVCLANCLHKHCSKSKCKPCQARRPVPKPRLNIYRRRTNSF